MQAKMNTALLAGLKKFAALPRWAQGISIVVVMGLMILAMSWAGEDSIAANASSGNQSVAPLALWVSLRLLAVLALIVGCAVLLRRYLGSTWRGKDRRLQVEETVHLSPRRALHLVRVGDQVFLLGATDQAINLLSEVDPAVLTEIAPADFPVERQPAPSFADVLAGANGAGEPAPANDGTSLTV